MTRSGSMKKQKSGRHSKLSNLRKRLTLRSKKSPAQYCTEEVQAEQDGSAEEDVVHIDKEREAEGDAGQEEVPCAKGSKCGQ